MSLPSDTSPWAAKILVDGYREMPGWRKLALVAAMNEALEQLAAARIRSTYGAVSERELHVRLAALRLGRDFMVEHLGWDPETEGW